jgi:sporulation protein YlmC with PRC-barrel domain
LDASIRPPFLFFRDSEVAASDGISRGFGPSQNCFGIAKACEHGGGEKLRELARLLFSSANARAIVLQIELALSRFWKRPMSNGAALGNLFMKVKDPQCRVQARRDNAKVAAKLIVVALSVYFGWNENVLAQSVLSLKSSTAVPFEAPGVLDPTRMTLGRECKVLDERLVKDAQEVQLGKIKDFIVDLEGGSVLGALIAASGGQVLVPATSFQSALEMQLQIHDDRQRFAAAPRVRNAQALLQNPEAIKASLTHFSSPQVVPDPSRLRIASKLAGMPITSDSGQPLGKVVDVFMDLTAGRLIYLIVRPTIGLEPGSRLYLLPTVMVSAHGTSLMLRAGAPHFLAGTYIFTQFPTEIVMSNVGIKVYEHYGLSKSIHPRL